MSTAKSWDSSYEWKAVLTLSLAFGLVGLDRFILPPLFPAMMKDLALNYQDLGNLVGALGIAWGVSAIVVGGLSDRLGRRKVLVPAVVIFSLLSVFSGMAQYTLYFALGGQIVGLMLSLFLRETAPRRASRGGSVSELDSVPESG